MSAEEETGDAVSGPCVGERLRAARDEKGMSLEEIALATRIPLRHLRTIERCEYEGLPAPTYSAGFVKIWARLVGLDGQALADEFRAEMGGVAVPNAPALPYEPADPRRTPPLGLALLALALAIVLTLGYLYWRGATEQPIPIDTIAADQAPEPAAPRPTVLGAPSATPPAQPAGPVVIGATQDVWIKVSDQGKTLFMNVLHPGEHFEVPADAVAPLMTTGRPGNTTITVGQNQIPPVGDPDRIAKDVSLKPADLLGRAVPAPTPPAANSTAPADLAPGT
ncbi:MAG TPA: helix-turn-helix domain-containing protein [Sphingomonas sp.]|nr:helix-turn-helix domain-containing protein [Sphingomonas sp.]